MKFNFKIQEYQTNAVQSVVDCFEGQPYVNMTSYRRDIGVRSNKNDYKQFAIKDTGLDEEISEVGFKNASFMIDSKKLLENIKKVQRNNNLFMSDELVKGIGNCSIDVEMETGTGKTYVYIKTMYELYKKYGWSKFIIVVPSIAIREGVKKSFEMTEEHFMQQYGKKIRYFVYDSSNLNQLDYFSSNAGINVMIINMQAFNTFKEGGNTNAARIIYSERDEFNSRRPIDVIKANNPILILDEPQKMGGAQTQKALLNFNPLFSLNYSATHSTKHNLVYALDAVDAYNQKLVKKIQVKGFTAKNLTGTEGYLYLDEIIIDPKNPPRARIEFEVKNLSGVKRVRRIFTTDDNLYESSKNMEQYKGYRIAEINPIEDSITFTNGEKIYKGDVVGDSNESFLRRIQIRETIKSHFQKEEALFKEGIKTLSLFFIDEVKKYRMYGEDGEMLLGEYAQIFEEEYNSVLKDYESMFETDYVKYLKSIDVRSTHNGYFSIDKKTGQSIDGKITKSTGLSDDISAYDLILKNKERLLSFEEPTRFIFSHSALREGWDNPNIFQICTLKKSDSENLKRQEVGRGLRICVDKDGSRMDYETLGSRVHDINKLTVIASESYESFVDDLQKQTKKELRDRPKHASVDYFAGKNIMVDGKSYVLDSKDANMIYQYMVKNDYVSDDGEDYVTDKYHADYENNNFAPMPEKLKPMEYEIHKLIQSVFNAKAFEDMYGNGHETTIYKNDLNDNFFKKEFQTLWKYINHKYIYKVDFDSEELIKKSIIAINENLRVSPLQYTMKISEQKDAISVHDIEGNYSFKDAKSSTNTIETILPSSIKYDLIGNVADITVLTRRTVARILSGIDVNRFNLYKKNPEEFISNVSRLIKEQKATMIVEHIYYDEIEGKYDSSIFTADSNINIDRALLVKKHIQPYVVTDGTAKESVEKKFARDLEGADEVCVYAKLPRGFSIPTPVGNYSPDWAIAFNQGSVKHIFFVAETKGTMESMELRPIELAKIECAKKLFNEISTDDVVYHDVDSYQSLLNIMPSITKTVK